MFFQRFLMVFLCIGSPTALFGSVPDLGQQKPADAQELLQIDQLGEFLPEYLELIQGMRLEKGAFEFTEVANATLSRFRADAVEHEDFIAYLHAIQQFDVEGLKINIGTWRFVQAQALVLERVCDPQGWLRSPQVFHQHITGLLGEAAEESNHPGIALQARDWALLLDFYHGNWEKLAERAREAHGSGINSVDAHIMYQRLGVRSLKVVRAEPHQVEKTPDIVQAGRDAALWFEEAMKSTPSPRLQSRYLLLAGVSLIESGHYQVGFSQLNEFLRQDEFHFPGHRAEAYYWQTLALQRFVERFLAMDIDNELFLGQDINVLHGQVLSKAEGENLNSRWTLYVKAMEIWPTIEDG